MDVKEQVLASKVKLQEGHALLLARQVDRIIAMKGKKVVELDLDQKKLDIKTLLKHMLGPTGNLRAPTIRKGQTLLVGFNEEAYQEIFG